MTELEDEISKALSDQIRVEIDKQVLTDLLLSMGWHRVDILEHHNKDTVDKWCSENFEKWTNMWPYILFEDEKDAILCRLKWA